MYRLPTIVCGVCFLLSASALKHHILTKSWDEAQSDCLEYLRIESPRSVPYLERRYADDQTTKELIFCIALNLRIYEAKQNVLHVELLRQFFNPDFGDMLHVNRTNECLLRVQRPTKKDNSYGKHPYVGAIESVHAMFRCFYYYYGNINRNSPVLPPTPLELRQIQQECAKIVGIPEGLLRCGSHLKAHPAYNKFAHCLVLRSGKPALELDHNSIKRC